MRTYKIAVVAGASPVLSPEHRLSQDSGIVLNCEYLSVTSIVLAPSRFHLMYSHDVNCTHPFCSDLATYKVAARWSDGRFAELKTYGFACSDHLGEVFQEAENRRLDYTLCPGEVIEEMAIYRFEPGKRDRQLQRLWGLEENYRA